MKIKLYRKIFLVVFIFIIWIILAGVDVYNIIVGLLCSILIVLLFGDINIQESWTFRNPIRYVWLLYYGIVFIYEVIKANLDVAYRILIPEMPIKPGIVRAKTKLKS
ncbi:MAG: Na+/H+ antiporter subunit E, partial [Endomicrobia bacterium]|nr:Na+/H+ antiporter subunit E [Endomicrobiia bacterium]